MQAPVLPPLVDHLRRAARPSADVADAELLARFARDRDDAAFAALVRRHGPLVLAVCRRILGHHDAEDACQTTFLILARKASGLSGRASVAGWLCGVARNVARKARRAAARRAAREAKVVPPSQTESVVGLADVCAALDAEVARLPDAEREAFTVCVLEGLSKARAARRLGWTEGTVSGRLARARERLRVRLARRGITLSAAVTAVALAGPVDALGPAIVTAVVRRACEPVTQAAATGLARWAAVTCLIGAALTAGVTGWLTQPPQGAGQPKLPAADLPAAKELGPRVDFIGDPLPDRVVARIGHQRFRHDDMVAAVAVSPDGKTIASGTWNSGVVRLWEAGTGKLVRSWDAGTQNPLLAELRFLDRGDRLFVGMTGKNLPPHIADVATGKVVWRYDSDSPLDEKRWGDKGAVLSPDGAVLVRFWREGFVRAVDRATGKVRFEKQVDTAVGRVAIGGLRLVPDGKSFLMIPGSEAGVWECSTATGEVLNKYDVGLSATILSVSGDGRYFAALQAGNSRNADAKDPLVIWDRQKNRQVCRIDRRFPEAWPIEFSPDGKTFAVGCGPPGAGVVLLNTADGSEVRRFDLDAYCFCLAFAPDGRTLVTGDNRGLVARWDVATGKQISPVPDSAPSTLKGAEFVADGRELLTYGDRITWWDPATGKPLRALTGTFSPFSPTPFYSSRLSPDSRVFTFFKAARRDQKENTLWLRDVATGEDRLLFDRLKGPPMEVQFSPDGHRLAVAGRFTPVVSVLDANTGQLLHELKDHKKYVDHALFSPDGRRIVSYGTDGNANGDHEIRVWDADTGKLLHKLPPVRGAAFEVAFTPDGKQLVSVGGDPGRSNTKGEIHVWDLETGKLVRVWDGHKERVTCVAVSPDGRSILTGGLDRTLRLWDLATGRLRHEFTGHRAYVTSVAFAPDGRRFVACSSDAPGYVWDLYGHLIAKPAALSADDFRAVWADLADADGAVGFRAVCRLAAGGDASVARLRTALKPVPAVEAAKVERWIADLGSDRFAVRERAAAELGKVADQVRPRLRKVLETEVTAEVRERVTKLLAAADADEPDFRRARRACEALEAIGTKEARRLAEELANGAPGARLTDEARGTAGRLEHP